MASKICLKYYKGKEHFKTLIEIVNTFGDDDDEYKIIIHINSDCVMETQDTFDKKQAIAYINTAYDEYDNIVEMINPYTTPEANFIMKKIDTSHLVPLAGFTMNTGIRPEANFTMALA